MRGKVTTKQRLRIVGRIVSKESLVRIKYKPGFIPPFYADLPKNFDELITSEINKIKSYLKKPLKTDVLYFLKAFYYIFFRGARSK